MEDIDIIQIQHLLEKIRKKSKQKNDVTLEIKEYEEIIINIKQLEKETRERVLDELEKADYIRKESE